MKKEYDFSKGRRGAVLPLTGKKTRITIRIDDDLLQWFRDQANAAGGGSYQTMINGALREFVATKERKLEDTVRTVVREELARYESGKKAKR